MKFYSQTYKNVHDVWMVFLETTLCVIACFVEFYVFHFNEIYFCRSQNRIQTFSGWKRLGKKSPRTIQGSLRKDPRWWQKQPNVHPPPEAIDAQSVGQHPVGVGNLYRDINLPFWSLIPKMTAIQDGPFADKRYVCGQFVDRSATYLL